MHPSTGPGSAVIFAYMAFTLYGLTVGLILGYFIWA